ncbi:MAG: hypothetical protein SF123_13830 [Chloroflexota bacterium]|nr:hypothetical protein [Chloroflexota bacterium]
MSIWRIDPDVKYTSLAYVDPENLNRSLTYTFKGKSVQTQWTSYPVFMGDDDELETGADFMHFQHVGSIACNDKALSILYPLVSKSVELFKLDISDYIYYAVNVINVVDCVDHTRTKTKTLPLGEKRVIGKPIMRKERCENEAIFKIPEMLLTNIFVSHRFKDLVETNNLTGLKFTPIETI